MKTPIFLLICGISVVGCGQKDQGTTTPPAASSTVTTTDTTAAPTTQPNNTAINARDRAPDAVTAGMQGQGKSDVDITAEIRRRVMDGKMSVDAQNVKIVSQSGKVTLRGPVDTQAEKDAIGNMANDVAGAANVDNQLEIKPNG
jgi:osmotically-inducible protein OsmY